MCSWAPCLSNPPARICCAKANGFPAQAGKCTLMLWCLDFSGCLNHPGLIHSVSQGNLLVQRALCRAVPSLPAHLAEVHPAAHAPVGSLRSSWNQATDPSSPREELFCHSCPVLGSPQRCKRQRSAFSGLLNKKNKQKSNGSKSQRWMWTWRNRGFLHLLERWPDVLVVRWLLYCCELTSAWGNRPGRKFFSDMKLRSLLVQRLVSVGYMYCGLTYLWDAFARLIRVVLYLQEHCFTWRVAFPRQPWFLEVAAWGQ